MSEENQTDPSDATVVPLVKYEVTLDDIRAMSAKYEGLTCETSEGYEETRKAIALFRTTRTGIEKRRVALKANALEYGRAVDRIAKELTFAIEPTEELLRARKQAVDDERERVKREKAEAEQRALEEKIRQEREAEEARLRAEREAEAARLKAEREAEEKRLAEERAALAAERARLAEETRRAEEAARKARAEEDARLAAERAKLAAERERIAQEERARQAKIEQEQRALEEERQRIAKVVESQERAQFERQARIRAEEEAKAKAERERVAAEEARLAEIERKERERQRLEALKPDREKLRAFAEAILDLDPPTLATPEAQDFCSERCNRLAAIAREFMDFGAVAEPSDKAAE